MAFYKQSTAYTRNFKMIDSADHFSKKTGLTCTVNISKAGGAFGAAGGTVTEVANGWYKVALTTTDTNTVGDLAFYITATGADDTDFVDQVWVRDLADLAYPATSGRSMVVDAAGLVDANMVKAGATGAGTAITARDIGASVLLSSGTGTGQLDFTSGVVKANATQWLGGTIPAVNVTGVPLVDAKYLLGTIFSTPTVAGIPNVNTKTWNDLATVELPLVPTTAGRKLDVSTGGEAGVDWANVGSPTTVVGLSGTTIKTATDIATATTAIQADTDDIQTRIPAALSGGNMKCDVLAISTDTVAADNAESFFDGTGYAGTNNVIPTVTTVTNQLNAAAVAAGVWRDAVAADFTQASSIGKSVMNGVALGTGLTINGYTGDTPQTGDTYALANGANGFAALKGYVDDIGVAGAGLTAIPWNAAWDAEVQSEVTDALDAYDGPTNAELSTALGTADDATLAAIAALSIPTANQNADALLDRSAGIETGTTLRQGLRLFLASLAGKLSGGGTTTITIRDKADSKDRIVASVDSDGNRTAITYDVT